VCGATVLRRARPHRSGATRHLANERRRRKRTAQEGEALRQKRRDFVRVDGDERARGNGVMTPHGAAGKDREDGQEQARGKPAATAVGEGGAVTAKTPRMTTIPSHQRATDSHNNTRPVALRKTFGAGIRGRQFYCRFKHWTTSMYRFPNAADSLCFSHKNAFLRCNAAETMHCSTCGSAYTSQKGRQLFFHNFDVSTFPEGLLKEHAVRNKGFSPYISYHLQGFVLTQNKTN